MVPSLVIKGWTRQYEDARIILEQNGDLHYLNISARVQSFLVRGGILATGAMLICISILLVTSIGLLVSRAKLERSHEEVYRALLSSVSDDDNPERLSMSEEQMVALAQTIGTPSSLRFIAAKMLASMSLPIATSAASHSASPASRKAASSRASTINACAKWSI